MITSSVEFADKTCLILDYHVDKILAETLNSLTTQQVEWFHNHCNLRIRHLHANNPRWRRWLENRNKQIDPRLQCQVWLRHWLTAYLQNPKQYQQRHMVK